MAGNTRPIPPVDGFAYMRERGHQSHEGVIEIKPVPKYNRVKLQVGGDAAYLDAEEALVVLLTYLKASRALFGEGFTEKVGLYLEQLEG